MTRGKNKQKATNRKHNLPSGPFSTRQRTLPRKLADFLRRCEEAREMSSQEDDACPISCLPQDILMRVLSGGGSDWPIAFMFQMRLVSSAFRRAATTLLSERQEVSTRHLDCKYGLIPLRVQALGEYCPSLVTLDLTDGGLINGGSIQAMASGCPHLQYLTLTNCLGLNDCDLIPAVSCTPNLKLLNVTKCVGLSAHFLQAVGSHCPRLQVLQANHFKHFEDFCLITISKGCPHLRQLHLRDSTLISDQAIIAVCKGFSHLEDLDISGCTGLRAATLIDGVARFAGRIQRLGVSGFRVLSEAAVRALVLGCRELRDIDMSFAAGAPRGALRLIGQHMPQLRSLNISGMSESVTEDTLLGIALGCPQLETLDASFTGHISVSTIQEIAHMCNQLKTVDFMGCCHLTDEQLWEIFQTCPRLTSVSSMKFDLMNGMSNNPYI